MMVTSLLTLKVDVFFRMLFILSVKLLQNKMKVSSVSDIIFWASVVFPFLVVTLLHLSGNLE